MGPRHL